MRVDDRNLSGAQAAQTGKSNNAQEIARHSEIRAPEARPGASADRVELSDLTGGLARTLSADKRQRASLVERLAADHAAGRYQVDARAVSRAIVAEMRAAGRPGA